MQQIDLPVQSLRVSVAPNSAIHRFCSLLIEDWLLSYKPPSVFWYAQIDPLALFAGVGATGIEDGFADHVPASVSPALAHLAYLNGLQLTTAPQRWETAWWIVLPRLLVCGGC